MKVAIAIVVLLLTATVANAQQQQRQGYLGRTYLGWDYQTKDFYVTAVVDTLSVAGLTCTPPVPSYHEAIIGTENMINARNAGGKWAAQSVLDYMVSRGCKF